MLYDKGLTAWRYSQKKESLWEEQAKIMELDVELLKTWYESQRSRYGRLGKTKSGMAGKALTEREKWLDQHMSFLQGHIHRQPSRQAYQVSCKNGPSLISINYPPLKSVKCFILCTFSIKTMC